MQTLTVNGGWSQFTDALKNRTDFRTHGALRGEAFKEMPGRYVSRGRLPHPWVGLLTDSEAVDYVVYSYVTPIAWHDATADVWVVPDVKYSVTTSKHQGRIETAISQLSVTV